MSKRPMVAVFMKLNEVWLLSGFFAFFSGKKKDSMLWLNLFDDFGSMVS